MIDREDFVWTIGYDGPAAVVDKQAKQKYRGLSATALAERGLFRAAYAAAVYSKQPGDLEAVAALYSKNTGTTFAATTALDRLFGVFPVQVKRTIEL